MRERKLERGRCSSGFSYHPRPQSPTKDRAQARCATSRAPHLPLMLSCHPTPLPDRPHEPTQRLDQHMPNFAKLAGGGTLTGVYGNVQYSGFHRGHPAASAAPAPSASVAHTAPSEPLAEAELVALWAVGGTSEAPVAVGSTAGGASEAPVAVGSVGKAVGRTAGASAGGVGGRSRRAESARRRNG